MDQFIEYLNKIEPLSHSLVLAIHQIAFHQDVPRKGYLFKAGTINNHIHFVLHGLIRCYYTVDDLIHTQDDREMNKWFFLENDFIAYRQSYDIKQPSKESYQAIEPSSVLTFHIRDLDLLCVNFPEFWKHVAVITSRFARQWYNMPDLLRGLAVENRYEELLKLYPQFVQRVPLKYLASFLDMHEVTLAKIRSNR